MASVWEAHRDKIYHQYIALDYTLKELMSFMKEEHGFEKSKNQYERQLAKWNFRKNTKGDAWSIIHRKCKSRERRQKTTAVYKKGRLVERHVLSKEKRHHFPTHKDQYGSVPTPKTPEGFEIGTPVASCPSSLWVNNLPFLQLQNHLVSLVNFSPVNHVHQAHDQISRHFESDLERDGASDTGFWDERTLLSRGESAWAESIDGPIVCSQETDTASTVYDVYARWELSRDGNHGRYLTHFQGHIPRGSNLDILASAIFRASNNLLNPDQHEEFFSWLCNNGNHPQLKALLSTTLPSAKGFARTWLPRAIKASHFALVCLLLGSGIDPDLPVQYNGSTPLLLAVLSGVPETVQLLLQHGADVNAPPVKFCGKTALQAAARGGHVDIVQVLLQHSADVNAPPAAIGGNTALQAAARGGHVDIVQVLLQHGADVNAPPADQDGKTALRAAARGGHVDIVQVLLQHGADVNVPLAGQFGSTALQAAARGGHVEIVQILLQHGADVNAPPAEYYGRTALQAAAQRGDLSIVQLLYQHGADIGSLPSATGGVTALQGAVIAGSISVVHFLLEAGANPNQAGSQSEGCTAVEAAAEHGRLDILQLLLNMGAEIDKTRAFEYAREEGHDAVIALLETCSTQ